MSTENIGFVYLTLVYGFVMNIILTSKVVKARKTYGIKYPNLYADRTIDGEETANKFNAI
jgi:hypothetical protein